MLYLLNIVIHVLNIYQTNDAVSEIDYVAFTMGSVTWKRKYTPVRYHFLKCVREFNLELLVSMRTIILLHVLGKLHLPAFGKGKAFIHLC